MKIYSNVRKWLFGIGVVFFLLLLGILYTRSSARHAEGGGAVVSPNVDENTNSASQGEVAAGSLELKDFHKVQLDNGKPIWEVRAKDAQHFPDTGVTHVHRADLKFFQAHDKFIRITADAAKLKVEGTELRQADLEGNIVVSQNDELFIRSDFASYDAKEHRVYAPGKVVIDGKGFVINGVGFEVFVQKQEAQIRHDVRSYFEMKNQRKQTS